ncbi:MAG: pectinesterase family protein [Paludibacteraceae bacterium]|nr:pectinesterase family protein [Paludibacteraceae bacterium]
MSKLFFLLLILPQVWDFGGDTLPGMQNMLSVAEINSWFPHHPNGTMSANLLSFTASDSVNLTYYTHNAHNHRLRTINPLLTHTDEKKGYDARGHLYRGFIYSNANTDPDVYIEQSFLQGDTIVYCVMSNGRPETYRFQLSDSSYYTALPYSGGKLVEKLRFICPKDGKYRLVGLDEKLVVARIIRYPVQHTLSKKEIRALNRMAHRPLRYQAPKTKYRFDFPDTLASPYSSKAAVHTPNYQDTIRVTSSIAEALYRVRCMNRQPGQRVTILIPPGNYEEMIRVDIPDITLKNASPTPSIAISNGGVDIDSNAVRITGYYGGGYNYYSMNSEQVYDPRTLKASKRHRQVSCTNKGGSEQNYWNAVTLVRSTGFRAENIIFENSFNQYISRKELTDVVVPQSTKPQRPRQYGSTDVQQRDYRERAAAIAFTDSTSGHLINCRVISRQDAFFGGRGAVVRCDGGVLMGGVDYIYGDMNLLCVNTELAFLTSSDHDDRAYITASRTPVDSRGMLFWHCRIRSAVPGVEMTSPTPAQPGYLGRPWARSGEAVFVEPQIDNLPDGRSIIVPEQWHDGLIGVADYPRCRVATDDQIDMSTWQDAK